MGAAVMRRKGNNEKQQCQECSCDRYRHSTVRRAELYLHPARSNSEHRTDAVSFNHRIFLGSLRTGCRCCDRTHRSADLLPYHRRCLVELAVPDGNPGDCDRSFQGQIQCQRRRFWRQVVVFNIAQVIGNAIAWAFLAPVLDILIYSEPANKVFLQGIGAFVGDIIVMGVLGTILLAAYSKVSGKSAGLKKED